MIVVLARFSIDVQDDLILRRTEFCGDKNNFQNTKRKTSFYVLLLATVVSSYLRWKFDIFFLSHVRALFLAVRHLPAELVQNLISLYAGLIRVVRAFLSLRDEIPDSPNNFPATILREIR